jgi:hypothetical protein
MTSNAVDSCPFKSLCLGGSGSWSGNDVRNSAIRVSVVSVWVSGVRRDNVLDSGEVSGVGSSSGVGGKSGVAGVSGSCWVAGVGISTDSVWIPRWIDSMDAEVLLSSFLILGLHRNDASGQSHQYQKALK